MPVLILMHEPICQYSCAMPCVLLATGNWQLATGNWQQASD